MESSGLIMFLAPAFPAHWPRARTSTVAQQTDQSTPEGVLAISQFRGGRASFFLAWKKGYCDYGACLALRPGNQTNLPSHRQVRAIPPTAPPSFEGMWGVWRGDQHERMK